MHETDDSRVLAIVDYDVSVFENEERLNENEQNARDLAHYSDRERSLTLYNQ
jgi:hypothetical protein